MAVLNKFPLVETPNRIAIIGDAPSATDTEAGVLFSDKPSRFLKVLLRRAGINPDACFFGNVLQNRPDEGKIDKYTWQHLEVQGGLEILKDDLNRFNPNITVLLGNLPLKVGKDPWTDHKLHPKAYRHKIDSWRGSLFTPFDGPLAGRKCVASYHPVSNQLFKIYENVPFLQFDLRRVLDESYSASLSLPQRQFDVNLSAEQIVKKIHEIRQKKELIGTDIEGYWNKMSCISFATRPSYAFILPFTRKDGSRYWPDENIEKMLWRELAGLLEDPEVPKVLQNGLYDRFCLHYGHSIGVFGVADDTMLKWWSKYSELPKGLDTQVSILTREPFYKGDRKSQDDETFYRYCCLDSAVTLEIAQKLDGLVEGTALEHHKFNMGALNPLLYMELRGIAYDSTKAQFRRKVIRQKMFEAQAKFNSACNVGLPWNSLSEVLDRAKIALVKKSCEDKIQSFEDVVAYCYKDKFQDAQRLLELINEPNPDLATMGEIEDCVDMSMNTGSDTQFHPFLYDELKLPIQYSDDKANPRPTANYEALLKLSKHCLETEEKEKHFILQRAIEIRALSTREGMLSIHADPDGRIRCGYNIVGSETGRVTCYTSPTGSGYNLQTIPKYTNPAETPGGILGDRDLILADPDCWFFQCDLAGADGWTVAAYCASFGDYTMLDDYLYGLKTRQDFSLNASWRPSRLQRPRSFKRGVQKSRQRRLGLFRLQKTQHGRSYLEGIVTVGRFIYKDSEGKFYMPAYEIRKLGDFFDSRYWGIAKYHQHIAKLLQKSPFLTAASGQVRQFFGRPDDILPQAVAFEPQANTTYATNLAMRNLWHDSGNRVPADERLRNGMPGLRVEPLHQVHDALCGQFKKTDTDWAVPKIQQWFQNELYIAGQKIIIPFEGGYGPSWQDLKVGKI
jgi:uracil-DNA glycosylase